MLTQETKRKIDSARQILVGKVPDPKAQVDQITTAMIYKFMDDMDKDAMELGGKARFFTNGFEKYAWSKLMDLKLGGHERLELYAEAVVQMSTNPHIPQLFRDIFKDAFLPYRSPETLSLFLKEINSFTYDHSEDLGDAFEYLLSIMGSQGDAGQFRTPRHIIDFIVAVVDPKKDDSILDPACGTAGFLISAYKHILKQHDGRDDPKHKEKPLTPDDKKRLMNNLFGYDISPDMVKLSKVNMYLHGFAEPKIFEYDTLSSDEKWDETYDVIMANPPFMTPKGGIRPHKRFSVQANRAEVLFVDYIKEHLRPNGRAGIIVPEGIIFKSDGAYKQLRKILIEDGLIAVVSLPSGVFNPYSNVKTAVLIFDNALAKHTNGVLFIKVENDGLDLGSQRKEVKENDLPLSLEIIKNYKQALSEGKKFALSDKYKNIAHIINKDKILADPIFNLTGDIYKDVIKRSDNKYPFVEVGDVAEVNAGNSAPQDPKMFIDGTKPFFRTSDVGLVHMHPNLTITRDKLNEKGIKGLKLFKKGTILFPKSGASTFLNHRVVMGIDGYVSSHLATITPTDKIVPQFLFYLLCQIDAKQLTNDQSYPSLRLPQISKIKIPLPPLEDQGQIIKEIESKQAIIENAKELISKVERERADSGQIFERLKCDWVELGEVCDTTSGGTPLKSKSEYYENGNIPWLRSGEVDQGLVFKSEEMITEKGLKNSSAKMFPKDTVLVAMYGATAGKVGLLKFEASTNQAICGILPSDKFIPEFLYFYLRSQTQKMIELSSGGAQPNISQNIIRKLKIPKPPKDIQQKIISMLSKEQLAIEASEQLIEVVNDQINEIMAE